MARLIKTDGTQIGIEPKNGNDFKWEELYEAIGGYIEIVRLGEDILIVDEEGLCKQLPINPIATELAGHLIVGPAVLCKSSQLL